jgi:hypothetical protein
MRRQKVVPTQLYKILRGEVLNLQASVKDGNETIYLFWGDRAIGKTTAAKRVAEDLPGVWYVPLNPMNTKSESSFVRALVEAMQKPTKWGALANLKVLTEETEPQIFLLDNGEELFNLKSRTPKTPPLLRMVKYLTEVGHGFAIISNEDIPPKIAVYREVWKRVRKVVKFEEIYPEDINHFAEAYSVNVSNPQKLFDIAKELGLTAIDLSDIFRQAFFNMLHEIDAKTFKQLSKSLISQRLATV